MLLQSQWFYKQIWQSENIRLDKELRLHYLEALGIDVWLPKALDKSSEHSTTDTECSNTDGESLNWDALKSEVADCKKCGLCLTRTQTVFGTGNPDADWMLVGEAPGQYEDEQGIPFVGRAGQLLTEMLRALGLDRDDVFITNILKCRPPNNRDPQADEIACCKDYLHQQIQLVRPKIILAVGRIAAQYLLNTDMPLTKLRARVHTVNNIPILAVYHPAYLLRVPLEKRKVWEDLQMALQTVTSMENR
jgi:DNA polymerase